MFTLDRDTLRELIAEATQGRAPADAKKEDMFLGNAVPTFPKLQFPSGNSATKRIIAFRTYLAELGVVVQSTFPAYGQAVGEGIYDSVSELYPMWLYASPEERLSIDVDRLSEMDSDKSIDTFAARVIPLVTAGTPTQIATTSTYADHLQPLARLLQLFWDCARAFMPGRRDQAEELMRDRKNALQNCGPSASLHARI